MKSVLPSCYFGNIAYFSAIVQAEEVWIETQEHFIKQTFRNRCQILGANGPINLTVPVTKPNGSKTRMQDIGISYEEDWPAQHLKSIQSAYHSSPFQAFLQEELSILLSKKYNFLLDLNQACTQWVMELLEVNSSLHFSENYCEQNDESQDFRPYCSPKVSLDKWPVKMNFTPYTQVFSPKFDFIPNLSILDVIFNEGRHAYSHLKSLA